MRFGRADPAAISVARSDAVETVRAVLAVSDSQLDYARAKLTFDRVIDPSVEVDLGLSALDRVAHGVRQFVSDGASADAKLAALRKYLHESGPWNDHRPFAYDQSDPLGRRMQNKLLHNYLATRLGQCVSMPALFIVLAERLGLDVAFGLAPDHVFVRVKVERRTINLETTSGAHPACDQWYRQKFPITDRSVKTGIYLRSLSKREGVAVLAMIVVEHLYFAGRYDEVIALTDVMLSHSPVEVNAILSRGSASGKLLEEIRRKFPNPYLAPPKILRKLRQLMERNMADFETAEKLGWIPFE